MPLRLTLELIPKGDESKKLIVGTLDIENDGTGDGGNFKGIGNYDFTLRGPVSEDGQTYNNEFWERGKFTGFERRKGYWSICRDILNKCKTDYDGEN